MEFPSDWHRDAYIAGLEREVAGAEQRLAELAGTEASEHVLAEVKERAKQAKAELDRLTAAKKPPAKKK